jgi:hypothetical protein
MAVVWFGSSNGGGLVWCLGQLIGCWNRQLRQRHWQNCHAQAQNVRRMRVLRVFLNKLEGHVRSVLLDACEAEIDDVLGKGSTKSVRGVLHWWHCDSDGVLAFW